jgi:hypothetical protein
VAGQKLKSPWTGFTSLALIVAGYLFLELIAGAPDSPLVPVLPGGVRVPSWNTRGAAFLGLDRLGRVGLTILSLGVVAIVGVAFLVLARECWRGRVRLAPVLVAGTASLVLTMAGPLLLSRDVYSYAAYGRMYALHGANPYVSSPSSFRTDPFTPVLSPQWKNTRSDYGPTFTLISAGVTRVTSASPAATIRSFQLLAGVSLAAAALMAGAACRKARRELVPLATAVVVLDPVLVLHTVGGGHNDALTALFLAGALWLSVRGPRTSAAITVLLTVATLVKLSVGVALAVWLAWLWRALPEERRGRTGALHASLVVATAAAITAPLWAGVRTVRSLSTLTSLEGWASGVRLVGRGAGAVARAVAGSAAGAAAGRSVDAVFLAVFAAALWLLLTRAALPAPPLAWGVSLLLLALAIPIFLPWYAAWFIPFLPFVVDGPLMAIGIGASVLLALTGIPAEPGSTPGVWHDMVLGVHYGAAPVMLALFAFAVRRVLAMGWALDDPWRSPNHRPRS